MTDYNGNSPIGFFYGLIANTGRGQSVTTIPYRIVLTNSQILGLKATNIQDNSKKGILQKMAQMDGLAPINWDTIKASVKGDLVVIGSTKEPLNELQNADIKVDYEKIKEVKIGTYNSIVLQGYYKINFDAGFLNILNSCTFIVDKTVIEDVKRLIKATPLSLKLKSS